jgi:hypothetical protein
LDARDECVLGTRLILGAEIQRVAGIDVFETKAAIVCNPEGFRETSGVARRSG